MAVQDRRHRPSQSQGQQQSPSSSLPPEPSSQSPHPSLLLVSRLVGDDPSLRAVHVRGRWCQDLLLHSPPPLPCYPMDGSGSGGDQHGGGLGGGGTDATSPDRQQRRRRVEILLDALSNADNTSVTSLHLDNVIFEDDAGEGDAVAAVEELLVAMSRGLTRLTRFVVTTAANGNGNGEGIGRVAAGILTNCPSRYLQTVSLSGSCRGLLDTQDQVDGIAEALATVHWRRSLATFQLRRFVSPDHLFFNGGGNGGRRRRRIIDAGVGFWDDDEGDGSADEAAARVDLSGLVGALAASCPNLRSVSIQHGGATLSDSALASLLLVPGDDGCECGGPNSKLERLSLVGIGITGSLVETSRALTLQQHQRTQPQPQLLSPLHSLELCLVDFEDGGDWSFRRLVRALASSPGLSTTLGHLAVVCPSLKANDYLELAHCLSSGFKSLRRLDMTASVVRVAASGAVPAQHRSHNGYNHYQQHSCYAAWTRRCDRILYESIGRRGFEAFVGAVKDNASIRHVMFPLALGYDRVLLQREHPAMYRVLRMYLALNRIGRSAVMEDRNMWNRFLRSLLARVNDGSSRDDDDGVVKDCSWRFLLLNPSVVTG